MFNEIGGVFRESILVLNLAVILGVICTLVWKTSGSRKNQFLINAHKGNGNFRDKSQNMHPFWFWVYPQLQVFVLFSWVFPNNCKDTIIERIHQPLVPFSALTGNRTTFNNSHILGSKSQVTTIISKCLTVWNFKKFSDTYSDFT